MKTQFLGRDYVSPLWAASGTFGWGLEAVDGEFLAKNLGALVTKGVSPDPMTGAPHPRISEVGHGIGVLNAIGLQNPGLEKFLQTYVKRYEQGDFPRPIWVNVLGNSVEGYAAVVSALGQRAKSADWLAGFELNVSCPNVDKGGTEFGSDPHTLESLVEECVKVACGIPVMVKLSPLTVQPYDIARAAVEGGASALAVANTLLSGLPDADMKGKWSLGRRYGGLSGPALKTTALRVLDQIASKLNVPLCGIGGIMNGRDVREFFNAGATVVQVGTAHFANPWICDEIARELNFG